LFRAKYFQNLLNLPPFSNGWTHFVPRFTIALQTTLVEDRENKSQLGKTVMQDNVKP
jgi:hypothetical protein